ncbi:hypothetical protein [Natronospora cellulosivora (SeqCode)]
MLKKFVFNLKEAYRKIAQCVNESYTYFLYMSLIYLLFTMFFTALININYLSEISLDHQLSFLLESIPNTFMLLDFSSKMPLLIIFVFVFFIYHTKKNFIQNYLETANAEIELIKKLKGNKAIARSPIIYISLIINTISLIIVLSISKVVYRITSTYLYSQDYGIKLLEFREFQITLFMLLFMASTILLFSITYYMFWDVSKKNNEGKVN